MPFGCVSTQLGHSEVATTSRFYAKWIDEEGRWPPATIGPTEVYSELLAKLGKPHQSPIPEESGKMEGVENPLESQEVAWRAGRDSNPRPSGSKPAFLNSRKRK